MYSAEWKGTSNYQALLLPILIGAPLRLRVETQLGLRYGRPHDIVAVS
jgi:hypothetical protein